MDLSQDIALAYSILEENIPFDIITAVCVQKDLSVRGKDWIRAMNKVVTDCEKYKFGCEQKIERVARELNNIR